MKRNNRLLQRVLHEDNLSLAFWKASKGKRYARQVLAYQSALDENLRRLGREISFLGGVYDGKIEQTVVLYLSIAGRKGGRTAGAAGLVGRWRRRGCCPAFCCCRCCRPGLVQQKVKNRYCGQGNE